MSEATQPALFVSHGAPTMILEPVAVRDFLSALGSALPRPRAVLAVSAHWETDVAAVSGVQQPDTIHDFYGFPAPLYALRYQAPGAPDLARRVVQLLEAAGLPCRIDAQRGLDHGAWVPLMLMYPDAQIPVTQLSVQTARGAAHHFRLGQALRALREDGVLVLASGGLTHNLFEFRGHAVDDPAPDWVAQFRDWMADVVEAGRDEDLIQYRARAPHGALNHPSEEHLFPLLVAAGARTPSVPGRRLHTSTTYGVLAMDAYQFA
jgi:4,5-DOPA dioxygenase extradiol